MFAKYAILFGFLIPIFFIDLYHRLILDSFTIPLALLGIAFSFVPGTDVSYVESILTGLAILIVLLFIVWVFEKLRKKEGMGGGDIKLLAALGAFMGVLNLAFILLLSSVLALGFALTGSKTRQEGIAFGPFLVVAACFVILLGERFLNWYLSIF